jgi:hypothetical protein
MAGQSQNHHLHSERSRTDRGTAWNATRKGQNRVDGRAKSPQNMLGSHNSLGDLETSMKTNHADHRSTIAVPRKLDGHP